MISKIVLHNIATYVNPVTINPLKINFIYGGNGTGKTSFSKYLSGDINGAGCETEWENSEHEQIVVYNRAFIKNNFDLDRELPGIFTLGKESIEIQEDIRKKILEKESAQKVRNEHETSKKKLEDDVFQIKINAEKICWESQLKFGTEFAEALTGFRGKKTAFFDKCLETVKSLTGNENVDYLELQQMYRAAFTKGLQAVPLYGKMDAFVLANIAGAELMEKVITGKADTPIGTFIDFLNASDWVKRGIVLSKNTNGKCPYCQQKVPSNVQELIEQYFDESYDKDKSAIDRFEAQYVQALNYVRRIISSVMQCRHSILSYEEFDSLVEQFEAKASKNETLIAQKKNALSTVVVLEDMTELLKNISGVIDRFNEILDKHNLLINNQSSTQEKCKELVWIFLALQNKDTIQHYIADTAGRLRGISSLAQKIDEQKRKIREMEAYISEKEAKITSVTPTVGAINKILEGFGFLGFSIAENHDKKGTYKIVRPNGEDASVTLSEGEHNFISFLYFYHLCFGSQEKTGVNKNKILVIDDPISSMDSNVLFIVSTLVKNIIKCCRENREGIKQVYILTHNVYFHKEITFLGSREKFSKSEAKYFVIRKCNEISTIVPHEDNPIKTSYELLWNDLREPSQSTNKGIFNTMRRILEHYFQVIGGINYEECINLFEGEELLICKALISYINDGSHSIFEDLIVSFDDEDIDKYLRVFKMVFEKLHHIDHYNMMMKSGNN